MRQDAQAQAQAQAQTQPRVMAVDVDNYLLVPSHLLVLASPPSRAPRPS